MATTTLERAFRSLSELPSDLQEELGARLLAFTTQWQALKTGIDRGTAELERGEGIEIADFETLLDNITGKHGRS